MIQKAAMLLGSTDEWTDQEAMIADFEERLLANFATIETLRAALGEAEIEIAAHSPNAPLRKTIAQPK